MNPIQKSCFYTLLIICVALTFTAFAADAAVPGSTENDPEKSVVAIDFVRYDTEKIRPGCGVVIDENGTLLVDKMLFREILSADATSASGEIMPVSGVFAQDKDLYLWKVKVLKNNHNLTPVGLAAISPAVGDPVMVLDPRDRDRGFVSGHVVRLKGKFNIQLNENISPAMRGAPVFNKEGCLCGILTDISLEEPSPYGWAAPVTSNTEFTESEVLSIPEWKLKLDEEWRASKKGMWHAATYHLMRKDYENAVPLLEKIIEKDAGDIDAHAQLGRCLGELGRFDRCIAVYERLAALQPEGSVHYFNLGQAYAGAGQYEKAADASKKAVALDDNNHKARYNLGIIYLSMGDSESAMAVKKVLEEKDPALAKRLAQAEKEIVPVCDTPASHTKTQ